MQITCQSCKSVFQIDDAKVPKKVFAVACPKCKDKITVDPNAQAAAAPAAAPAAPAPAAAAPPAPAPEKDPSTPVNWGDLENMRKQIVGEVARWAGAMGGGKGGPGMPDDEGGADGANQALVCDDEEMIQQIIGDQLKSLGYQVTFAATAEQSQKLIKDGIFKIITVDNRFPDDNEGGLKILNEVNLLSADKRRNSFVAFITADLTTNDQNSAFLLGANITVNKKELKKLKSIIVEGLKNHRKQYRVLEECQREVIRELSSGE